jgi:hypothetical protein
MDSSKERLRDVLRQCGLVDHVLRVLSATAQLPLTAATNKTVSLNGVGVLTLMMQYLWNSVGTQNWSDMRRRMR